MPILQTHRRAVLLVERARVHVDEARVVRTEAVAGDNGLARSWNIPSLNCCVVILGQGASITQPAARRLADDGVMVGFAGTGGTPIFSGSLDYRPTERLQVWISKWPDPVWRLKASKRIQEMRQSAIRASWSRLATEGFTADPSEALDLFAASSGKATSVEVLMGAEGHCAKELYRLAASATNLRWSERRAGLGDDKDKANHFLDHGNYLAYGLASVALWALGVPASLPVTHGVHRGGGLVFDIADIVKDAIVLPTAFQCAADDSCGSSEFRSRLVERLHGATWLDSNGCLGLLFDAVDALAALPGEDP